MRRRTDNLLLLEDLVPAILVFKNETKWPRRSLSAKESMKIWEKDMFTDLIAMLIVAAVIVLMVLWVPLQDVICPPCRRFLERGCNQKSSPKVPFSTVSPKTYAE
jgi:hypothetical protein